LTALIMLKLRGTIESCCVSTEKKKRVIGIMRLEAVLENLHSVH
jgi:hypothetical protein